MGISFVILAISGLVLTFGKHILIPVIGYTLFAWLAQAAKIAHNFVAPVFAVALPIFIILFVRDNLPKAYDAKWIAKFGGMLDKSGGHVPSGRFNAGEKALFWGLVCVLSVILIVSGFILLFPTFDQTRQTMAISNTVHMVAAMLATAMACFHIYLGTVGMKGALPGDALRLRRRGVGEGAPRDLVRGGQGRQEPPARRRLARPRAAGSAGRAAVELTTEGTR